MVNVGIVVCVRCLSIPVTMRALYKCWQREAPGLKETTESTSSGGSGGGAMGGLSGGLGGDPNIIIKEEPGSGLDPSFDSFSGPDGGCPGGLQLADDKTALINLLSEPKQGKKRKRESSTKKKQVESSLDDIVLDSSSEESVKDLDFDLDLMEKKSSPPSILLDLEHKNLVPPSVSITPITVSSMITPTQSLNAVLERRPGIEIIPLVPTSLPSSITITPITNKEDRSRKSGKSSKSEEKSRADKKRKRRKEDSGMGPPDKLPMKQDPLTKPVTVSIKPTECGSPRPQSPNSSLRKYSSSPTPLSLVSSKGSPKSVKHSPKHSPGPAYSVSSPKSSPKHGTSSPKHQGNSGKPSMSALKSAVSSPKSDSSTKKSSGSKDSSREKDRKSGSSGHQSPKLKSSTVKLKQLDLSSPELTILTSGGSTPPSSCGGDGKSQPMMRNRKGSLSAIVDKLKSAQHCGDPVVEGNGKTGSVKDRGSTTPSKTGDKSGAGGVKTGDSKNPGEYMVKPSLDGMKITINKTRTKEGKSGKYSSSSSSSGSGSPKTHTGLKPGVNSGPASKKPQSPLSAKVTSSKTSSKLLGTSKSSSSSVKPVKSSSSRDSRPRTTKPGEKSIFSSSKSDSRRLSPSSMKEDSDTYKTYTPPTISPELVVQGLMKQLDTKFQIPKLSQRNANLEDMKKDKFDGSKSLEQTKFMDLSIKADLKYPLVPVVAKLDDLLAESSKQALLAQSVKAAVEIELVEESATDTTTCSAKDDILSSLKIELPIGSMSFASEEPSPEVSEPIRPPDPPKSTPTPQEAAEILLDFSTLPTKTILPEKLMSVPERAMASVMPIRKNTPPPLPPPAVSPSVSVHIVKSPAPSPLVIPSPHSASPCITDDELMDEALVGIGK